MEDRLSSINEWLEQFTLVVLDALLIDVELHLVKNLADKISCVLQTNGKSLGVCCISEEVEVVGGIGCSEANTICIGIPVNVVRINSITAFTGSNVNSGSHNGANVGGLGVEPPFALPTFHSATFVGGLEVCLVGAPVLETACREVTDDFLVCSMESVDGRLWRIKQIKVEYIGRIRRITDNARQLYLPSGTSGRLPELSSSLGGGRICSS